MSQHNVVLLLGSNKNSPKLNIENAIRSIGYEAGEIVKMSKMIETIPVEFASFNIFCNIALHIATEHSPLKLLKILKGIEVKMGRLNDSKALGGYQDRIIDIDIVTYDNIIFSSSDLEIPHNKHLYEREFSKEILSQL